MRLEKFKSVLIPIDLVWYAYYDEGEGETAIVLSSPNYMGMSREIRLSPNCLNEFQEWYNGFKSIAPTPDCGRTENTMAHEKGK